MAATPVRAALISQFALGEPAGRATSWTIAAVLSGIAIVLFGGHGWMPLTRAASGRSFRVGDGAVSLLLPLEAVLSPLWVWWALNDALAPATLIWGALVIGVLTVFWIAQRPRVPD